MICADCITSIPLKRFASGVGTNGVCNYCGINKLAVDSRALFENILQRVDENLATEDDLSYFELGMLYECGSDDISVACIDIVLAEWMQLGEEKYFDELMKFVPACYLKNEKGQDKHFYDDDGTLESNIYEAKWNEFVADIRHAHRFFNPNTRGFLASLFSFLSASDGTLKPECLRIVPMGEEIFRARSAHSFGDAKRMKDDPVNQFGLAPKEMVGSQRMTPNGIPALYCAFERQTCLSEIRSITGDNVVSIAMTPTAQLTLLDLTKLENVKGPEMALLDPGQREFQHLQAFVRNLVKKMSRPKGRSDELIYISTQVVFEFLRLTFASQVHGLVFPSVQTGEKGTNLVLFPEFCTVSKDFYTPPDELDKVLGNSVKKNFEKHSMLAYVANSIRFHKVTAIVTEAEEHSSINNLYMSDLDKRRLHV